MPHTWYFQIWGVYTYMQSFLEAGMPLWLVWNQGIFSCIIVPTAFFSMNTQAFLWWGERFAWRPGSGLSGLSALLSCWGKGPPSSDAQLLPSGACPGVGSGLFPLIQSYDLHVGGQTSSPWERRGWWAVHSGSQMHSPPCRSWLGLHPANLWALLRTEPSLVHLLHSHLPHIPAQM